MSDMERVTVSLIPKASAALRETSELLGINKTDVINRALQAYAYLERASSEGGTLIISKGSGSEIVKFL